MSEVIDNKWEAESVATPVKEAGPIGQILFFTIFAGLFAWILSFSLMGAFGAKSENSLADKYKNLNNAPAEAAE